MRRIANRLDNAIVTCNQVMSAGGRYDGRARCYRFPDGSAGKLITFSRKDMKPSYERHLKFIEVKVAVEERSHRTFPGRSRVASGAENQRLLSLNR